MKIQPLYDLQQEINRLFIAGSKFAAADPRLTRLVPIFEKMGEKAPVFKKMAADITSLTEADAKDSATRLMALGVLLYSVLYTQGEALAEGVEKTEQTPVFDIKSIHTERSHAQLKVLREIAKGGSGRLELMKNAHETDVFQDFRSFASLDACLEDKYTELADYAEDVISLSAGPGMIPFLMRNFALVDQASQVRRLRCLIRLNAPEVDAILPKIFEEPLPLLQVAAIAHLGKDAANEAFLFTLARDKNKKVREAAYGAIAAIGSDSGLLFLTDLYAGAKTRTSLSPLAQALGKFEQTDTFETLLTAVKDNYAYLVRECENPKADNSTIHSKMYTFIDGLTALLNKKHPEALALLRFMVADRPIFALLTGNAQSTGAWHYAPSAFGEIFYLLSGAMGKDAALDFYAGYCRDGKMADVPLLWLNYWRYAAGVYPAAELYAVFSDAAKKNRLPLESSLGAVLTEKVSADTDLAVRYDTGALVAEWADVLYAYLKKNPGFSHESQVAVRILHSLEPMDSKRFSTFLKKIALSGKDVTTARMVFGMRVDRNIPGTDEEIFSYIEKHYKTHAHDMYSQLAPLYMRLPEQFALKLKEMAEKNKNYFLTRMAKAMLGEAE